ncbi:unnamed protein product, partial [Polarella glacialis]
AEPFNCLAGYYSSHLVSGVSILGWEETWSDGKKEWCCANTGNGCPQKRFDCEAGSGNWINSWPSEKQAWCCANEQKGCQAHHVNLYSCDGSTDQLEDWSVHKRDWCCTNRGVGCHVAADISTPGFHCHVALNNWHAAWSPLKKTWCCEHRSVGCPETQFQAHAGVDHYQYHVGSPLEGQPLQQQLPRVTSRHAYFPGFQ